MSRTSLAVVRLRSIAPPLRAQASATRRERVTFSVIEPSAPGQDRRFTISRSSGASPQLAFGLPPTPRGSRLTMSYRPSVSRCNRSPFCVTRCTPEEPGPPGITISVPRRAAGRSLRTRVTARESCGPSGSR